MLYFETSLVFDSPTVSYDCFLAANGHQVNKYPCQPPGGGSIITSEYICGGDHPTPARKAWATFPFGLIS